MNAKEINILLKNNTGNKDKESLINSFVVRTKIFNNIFSELKLSKSDKPEQNYLVIGQRGAGKTTLLHRLKYAILDDVELSSVLIPIMLKEEQYNLLDLINLWETIADQLDDISGFGKLTQEIEILYESKKYTEELAYEVIEKSLAQNHKKIIVFIENIDVFFKKIGIKGQQRLREVLSSSKRIRLIASSTTFFEGVVNYSDPFYEFFKIIQLDGLTLEECGKLLLSLAEQRNEVDNINKVLKDHPQRLESLRKLTGGNPRIIAYLFHIFLDNENGKAIMDLYKLLDEITFLYKAELDQLSAQQQKVIDTIARNWDAVSTKEISQKTKIDSKQVSSILNVLEKNQLIEIVSTSTKNNLYILKDRFLNIWYLMRFGKTKEIENVIWLVRFFDAWCDKAELSQKILSHIDNLRSGKYDTNAALDMGNVFLACANVPHDVKYSLYETTKAMLPKQMIGELQNPEESLNQEIRKLIKNKKWDEALKAINDIKTESTKLVLLSWYYNSKGDSTKAVDYLEQLYNNSPSGQMAEIVGDFFVSIYSENNVDEFSVKAKKYFLIAIENKVWSSSNKLGKFYFKELDDFENAEKYYKIAIDHGVDEAVMNLAEVLFFTERLEESKVIVEQELKKGEIKVKSKLALILQKQGKIDEAEKYFKEAIIDGNNTATFMLVNLYMSLDKPRHKDAQTVLKAAIKKGVKKAYSELGKLYYTLSDKINAEKILLDGIKNEDAESAHLLAHLYSNQKKWEKAEELYIKSIRWGRLPSIMCLAESAFKQKKEASKLTILNLFEEYKEKFKSKPLPMLSYAKYLIWNDRIENSVDIFKTLHSTLLTCLNNSKEEVVEDLMEDITSYFIFLISRGQYNAAYELLSLNESKMKNILKPVYYALMGLMKNEFPNEYLKAGKELKETIDEINKEIKLKQSYQ